MVEVEDIDAYIPATRQKQFSWLLSTLIRPVRTLQEILGEERATWLTPMLLLTVLVLVSVFVSGPLRQQAALTATPTLPPNFEYMSPDQQQQYMQAQASSTGSTQTYVFPALGEGIGLWLRWFVLGAVLHLALTMLGSRSTSATAFNLAAWASLPFAIRLLVQIGAMLATHQLIRSPGLSGMLAVDAKGVLLLAKNLLSMVDLYLFWQIGLLWAGARIAGLPGRKALGGVMASVILLLALSALPAFLTAQFSGLDVNRPFFLF